MLLQYKLSRPGGQFGPEYPGQITQIAWSLCPGMTRQFNPEVGRFTSVAWSVCPGIPGQASRNAMVKYRRNTFQCCRGTSDQFQRYTHPNATIYISKPEVDFWFGPGNKEKAPEGLKNYYAQAEASVGPYLKAGKVKTFTYGKELFPGITSIATPGHTPGHTAYALQSKGQKLVFWGDIMHIAAVQFPDPAVTIVYDVDQTAAKAQREKVFADAAKNGYWVAGDHLSFPGI